MTYTVHNPRLFFDAVVAHLVSSTGRPIGEAVRPEEAALPYAVVYPMPDVAGEGPLSDPTQVVTVSWQVTCVGGSMEQAQWMQHKARAALLGWTPIVSGLGTTPVDLAPPGSGVTRDDDAQPPLFYSTDRFKAYTSS